MLNQCNFIGRLTKDPVIRYTQGGDAIANFSIACSEKWTKDGQKQEKTEFVNCSAFKKLAEIIGEFLTKGSLVFISGKFQTRKWQDKEGNERYSTDILVNEMKMLSAKSGDNSQRDEPPMPEPGMGDDVPF